MNARFPTSFHDAPGRTELPALSSPALTQSAHKDFLLSAECLSHLAHLSLRYTSLRFASVQSLVAGLFQINQILDSSASSTPPFSSVVALVAVTETSLTATALTMVEVLLFLILM